MSENKFYLRKEVYGTPLDDAWHIAFTGTANYVCWIGVTMTSIMQHNPNQKIQFYLLVDDLEKVDDGRLHQFIERWSGLASIIVFYMNDDYLGNLAKIDRYKINGKYVCAFLYRFFVADVLNGETDRVLYLDGDIVCNGSLSSYMNMELGNHIVVGAEDIKGPQYAKHYGMKTQYFNAGVMLINVNAWNTYHAREKCLGYMKEAMEKHIKLPCADQDALNVMLTPHVLFVSHRFNMPYRLVRASFFKKKIVNENPMTASLIHFIGAIKPWTTYNQSVPIVKVWADAKADSPWKDVPLHKPESQKALHQAAKDARERGAYGDMFSWYGKFLKSKVDGTKRFGW